MRLDRFGLLWRVNSSGVLWMVELWCVVEDSGVFVRVGLVGCWDREVWCDMEDLCGTFEEILVVCVVEKYRSADVEIKRSVVLRR